MNTSNKRLKIGASFPGFYLTFLTPRLARLSLLTPCLTLARASQQILAFSTLRPESLTHPGCELPSPVWWRRVPPGRPTLPFPSLPVRQRVLISRQTPARAPRLDNLTFSTPRPTYLSVFTCPTQRAWTSRRTPARAPRPDNLTFSTCCATRLPLRHGDLETSRTSTRASQTTTSPFLARRGLPVRHGDLETSRTSTWAYRSVKLIFSILRPAKAYPTTLPVDREAFRPLNSTLLSKPVHSVSPDIPTDAGESTPGQTTFSFQIYARRC